ncbi:MAG: SWFGD domain-containing protein, partial [Gemmatimonadaceae bacterium]
MAYDRYDPRDERSRWRGDRNPDRRPDEDRGFFERAGDEVASWFGDEEAERRRREDQRMSEREQGRDWRGEEYRGRYFSGGRDEDRGRFTGGEWERGPSERDESRFRSSRWTGGDFGSRGRWGDRDFERGRDR